MRVPAGPTLEELAAEEAAIASRVAAVTGTIEEKLARLRSLGVFASYARVFAGYLALAEPPRSDVEALKRATFLTWYEAVEPGCFTGVGELPPDSHRRIVELLEPLAPRLDEEFRWMLAWYYRIADYAFPELGSRPRLRALVSGADPRAWQLHRATAGRMAGRGLMGEYWLTLFETAAD